MYGLIAHHHLLWLQQNALIRLQQRLVRLNQLDDTKELNAALHLLLKGALALSVAAQNSGYFFHQLDSQ